MNVTAILFAALIVGGVGILIGFFLGISGEKFKVEVDEKEEAILGVLPGNNCGGCGYSSGHSCQRRRSLSARRAWIEILMKCQVKKYSGRRSPQGERG